MGKRIVIERTVNVKRQNDPDGGEFIGCLIWLLIGGAVVYFLG